MRRRRWRSGFGAGPGAASLALVLAGCASGGGGERTLDLPRRPVDAPGGTALAEQVGGLSLEAREERIFAEVMRGNVPSWLRELRRIEVRRQGRVVAFWVTPDYLAVGSDDDWLWTPLSPQTAQRIADRTGTSLPTPAMVDAVWRAAEVRLEPSPIPPSDAMTTVPVFRAHDRTVRAQREAVGAALGALTAGHEKDVVLAPALDTLAGRVAIYGWHRPDGTPIQPLYLGHTDRWVDYSHGIRLVDRRVVVDGKAQDLAAVLADPARAGLLSDHGPLRSPRYRAGSPTRAEVPPPRVAVGFSAGGALGAGGRFDGTDPGYGVEGALRVRVSDAWQVAAGGSWGTFGADVPEFGVFAPLDHAPWIEYGTLFAEASRGWSRASRVRPAAGARVAWVRELAEYAGAEIRRSGPALGATGGVSWRASGRVALELSTTLLAAHLGEGRGRGVARASRGGLSPYWTFRGGIVVGVGG